jgi:Flp pilus assembly protein TadG
MIIKRLRKNDEGAAVVEMAFALPILLTLVYGIFQLGVIFAANAGMQHALGEGARMATLYPSPTDTAIKDKMNAKLFGTKIGKFTVADPTGTANYKDLQVSYTVTPNFLFFKLPAVTINRTKRVYLSF